MGLDHIVEREGVLKWSVGGIIGELFYTRTYKSFGLESGLILHHRLGFTNSEKYCRYFTIGEHYVKLCGVPDRISFENGILYVDELKTTISRKKSFMIKVGSAQLQLYMFITGIHDGRLFIYYKDTQRLVLERMLEYDPNRAWTILNRYYKIYLERQRTIKESE